MLQLTSRTRQSARQAGVVATLTAVLCLLLSGPTLGQVKPKSDLTEFSLEDLMSIEVTSVSKKAEKVSLTNAAVFVITSDDIRRSGSTCIPEALRLAPGIHVARVDGSKWVISIRGFSDRFANKLLVLVDGRSVYTPIFAGVWWDTQDTIMDDIDRIEVIRGPGATVWGANAVSGVINIVTKKASSTQSGLAATRVPNQQEVRYGERIGKNGYYRIYTKRFDNNNTTPIPGRAATDDWWHQERTGFRMDLSPTTASGLTMEGEVFNTDGSQRITTIPQITPAKQTHADGFTVSGGNVLTKWTRSFASGTDSMLQFYFDRFRRVDGLVNASTHTFDVEYQENSGKGTRNEIVWGIGCRLNSASMVNTPLSTWTPKDRDTRIYNLYWQDDISIVPNRFRLTLGTKLEHNSYTGLEIQPSIRTLWTPSKRHTLWTSASRAVRTPSEFERDATLQWDTRGPTNIPGVGPVPVNIEIQGNPKFKSEDLIAYEFGYRTEPSSRLSIDLATFYNNYSNYRSFETRQAPYLRMTPYPHIVVPVIVDNLTHAQTYGGEVAANYLVSSNWKLSGAYSLLRIHLGQDPGSNSSLTKSYEGNNPRNQISLRSSIDLPGHVEFDATYYRIGKLTNADNPIAAYSRLDLRLGWQPKPNFELSVGVQNLLDNPHREYFTTLLESPTQVDRTVFASVGYGF